MNVSSNGLVVLKTLEYFSLQFFHTPRLFLFFHFFSLLFILFVYFSKQENTRGIRPTVAPNIDLY